MEPISMTLQDLMAVKPGEELVPVHIMLQPDINASDAEAIVAELRQRSPDPDALDYLRHMRIAFTVVPLNSMTAISQLPGVMAMDLDSEAPLAELLDSPS